jgi:hypothetical protein
LQEGGVWVWYGGENGLGANGTPANADWYVEGEASSAGLDAAGAAGDVNGDGFGDLVIGNGWVGDGSAHVWYGSESGLGTGESVANADWTVTGPADPFGSFGNEVDGAGDVNGDGFSDIIVAAPFHTTLSDREGAAYVYHGSPAGPSMTPDWTGTDTLLRGRYAASISPAGDVNGDGFSDVLVGQYRFVPGMIGPGRAFCYLGSASGLETTADWMVENEPGDDSDHFAEVVAGAGDVNGDGFSDVMVTAIGAGTGGLIYVYYGNDGGWFNPSRNVQQIRADGTAPIDLLGASDAFDAFNVRMNARSALGRADVTLEWEVKRIGESFDGTELQQGVLTLTGIPDEELGSFIQLTELVGGLEAETPYKWRARVKTDSPFYPHSPWFTPARNGLGEYDLRTAAGANAVVEASPAPIAGSLVLGQATPNPFNPQTTIGFTLPERAHARLGIYDITGRLVETLTSGTFEAGSHDVTFQADNLPSGTYLYRLQTEVGAVTGSLILLK